MSNNPVLDFLKEHPSVIFSPKTISNKLKINKKIIFRHSLDPDIKRANSIDVGSWKHGLTLLYY
jgi:hypothetical protein